MAIRRPDMADTENFVRRWMAEHRVKPEPPKKPRRVTKAILEQELADEREARQQEQQSFRIQAADLNRKIEAAEQERVAAQRGLVPYVRALDAFHVWLLERPKLAAQVEGKMRDLEIWAIKLGYDPREDIRTSLASPERMNRIRSNGGVK